jgi:putative hydrolase of the HAD superfamily
MFKNKVTDIFFDLDHTLWDFDKNSALAFDKIFNSKYPSLNTQKFIEVYAPINQACWKLYQIEKITHDELRYKRLRDSFNELNFTISDKEINQISIDYIEYLPENNMLFEGAIEILEYLNSNYKLHVITNGFAEVQFKKLKNSQINHFFKTITNSEMAGVKKPHPKIYEHALNSAQVSKDNAIMIGDCLDADVKGAIDFGIEAIYFNPDNNNADIKVNTISKLIELKNYF